VPYPYEYRKIRGVNAPRIFFKRAGICKRTYKSLLGILYKLFCYIVDKFMLIWYHLINKYWKEGDTGAALNIASITFPQRIDPNVKTKER
jgi:hypothetical protein